MKILLVIDNFGSGGAQRQMVNLACGLKKRGHDVNMFVYFPQYTFFREFLEQSGIPIHEYSKKGGGSLGVLTRLISLIRLQKYDVVLSYLNGPNAYVELASLFAPKPKYIISERTSHYDDKNQSSAGLVFRRNLHRVADYVVVNSVAHREWLQEHYPWIKDKCDTIYNGLNINMFNYKSNRPDSPEKIRLIAIGSVVPNKNLHNVIEALRWFYSNNGWIPAVSWVGRREDATLKGQEYCHKVDTLLDSLPQVKQHWRWLGERSDIPDLLAEHSALIHPSFYEGLPNVVCEALAAGRPVIASNVCDNASLVPDGVRGFLFDPDNPPSIANAIERLVSSRSDEWISMSKAARQYAEDYLTIDKMVKSYEALFEKLTSNNKYSTHSLEE